MKATSAKQTNTELKVFENIFEIIHGNDLPFGCTQKWIILEVNFWFYTFSDDQLLAKKCSIRQKRHFNEITVVKRLNRMFSVDNSMFFFVNKN